MLTLMITVKCKDGFYDLNKADVQFDDIEILLATLPCAVLLVEGALVVVAVLLVVMVVVVVGITD